MKQGMDEELRNLQLDRLDKRGKSPEQVKRHSLDVSIENKPIDKALYLLAKGDDIQKLSVVENLPHLIEIDSAQAFNKILPKIQQELAHSSSEFNITASHVFQILIEGSFKTDTSIIATVLQGLDAKDPLVANAWLETLLQVILILPLRIVQTEVLPLTSLKGQCSQPVSSRVTCCKIVGKIVLHTQIKAIDIKKDILPLVYSLCQDVNYTVRAAICEQIPAIAKGLGANMVKNLLLSNLVELSSDDNQNVRAIAVSSVVQILPYLDKETKMTTMVPLVMNLCDSNTKLEEAYSVVVAKDMGLLLTSLNHCLAVNQADQLVKFYQQLARRGLDTKDLSIYNVDTSQDVKGREYCAHNFPQVMDFTLSMCPNNVNKLYDIFKELTFDSCYIVRLTIAGNFHEVSKIMGPRNSIMKTEFVRLLKDEAEEVLHMLVPNITTILMLFLDHGTLSIERSDSVSSEIGKALLKCLAQLMKGYNWRLTTTFLKQLEALPMVFRSDQIHNEFTPQIVRCALQGRTKPVRSQSVRTLLFFLRWNTKLMQRNWLRDHLIHELGENKCCYTRHVFIMLCNHAAKLFSHRYFKENFFAPLLKLSSDKVSTIRYSVVNFFPQLRKMLRLPVDRKLLTSFEQVIIFLEKNEKDRDVLANLVTKTKEMMSPMFNTINEESEAIQRKLMLEEDNVTKGKLIFNQPYTTEPKTKNSINNNTQKPTQLRSPARTQSEDRESSRSRTNIASSAARSTSVPRQQIIRDEMIFLKQHFYIDAGVELPLEETNTNIDDLPENATNKTDENLSETNINISASSSDISDSLSDLSLNNADFSADNFTTNMTDDVKVNMRRKKLDKNKRLSQSGLPTAIYNNSTKNKRHSSFIDTLSTTSASNRTLAKRRSLNIQQKEFSKIPVMLKAADNIESNRIGDDRNKDESEIKNKNKEKKSNLPVFVRRHQK